MYVRAGRNAFARPCVGIHVRSPDGDTEYFDIVAGVLQGDTLAPYLFIICLDYVLRTSIDKIKENGFELTKKRSKRYPATTITDADYADDIAILANTPDQAETLLHSLERAAASIGLYVNAHKTEYMWYNQTGDISTLEGTPLKLVDKFTYLGSSVESTEKDIETRLTKAWTAINRLSIIWKSDLTDKMKRSFFQAAVTSILLYACTTWTLTKQLEKKLCSLWTSPGSSTPQAIRWLNHVGWKLVNQDNLILCGSYLWGHKSTSHFRILISISHFWFD